MFNDQPWRRDVGGLDDVAESGDGRQRWWQLDRRRDRVLALGHAVGPCCSHDETIRFYSIADRICFERDRTESTP